MPRGIEGRNPGVVTQRSSEGERNLHCGPGKFREVVPAGRTEAGKSSKIGRRRHRRKQPFFADTSGRARAVHGVVRANALPLCFCAPHLFIYLLPRYTCPAINRRRATRRRWSDYRAKRLLSGTISDTTRGREVLWGVACIWTWGPSTCGLKGNRSRFASTRKVALHTRRPPPPFLPGPIASFARSTK